MPGRPRKTLKNSTGNLTTVTRLRKMAEEEAISGRDRSLLEEPPIELRDHYAKEAWTRILPDVLEDPMVCNLDRDNLICYCNAWSMYAEAVRKMKYNKKDTKYQGLWMRRLLAAADEQKKYGKLCGMDTSSRLKSASAAVDNEKKNVEKKYGAI